jgi:ketosteroid isomerase-like protein
MLTTEELNAEEKALFDTDAAYSAAAAAKDIEKAINTYADHATLGVPGEPAHVGKAAIRQFIEKQYNTPGSSLRWTVTGAHVARSGELGYTTGITYATTTDASGKKVTVQGKYLVIWNKMTDGTWKAVHDVANDDTPQQQPVLTK